MKRMLKLAVVLTVAAMAMATVMVHGQITPTCFATFRAGCSDTSTPSGATQCCATLSDLYQNDLTCLCSLFQSANVNASSMVTLLTGCGVNTGGTSPCSGGSPVPISPAPQPSVVRSPPPPPSSIPSPPKKITASPPPPPPSSIPSPPKKITASPPPPSIFGSMSSPPFNTPPPPVNDTLGGRNGAASSRLIGMAQLVCSLLFGLIFVAI